VLGQIKVEVAVWDELMVEPLMRFQMMKSGYSACDAGQPSTPQLVLSQNFSSRSSTNQNLDSQQAGADGNLSTMGKGINVV
jgi:hypothetical protein